MAPAAGGSKSHGDGATDSLQLRQLYILEPHPTANAMDIVATVTNYVTKMLSSDGSTSSSGKMRILLLDSETVHFPLPNAVPLPAIA